MYLTYHLAHKLTPNCSPAHYSSIMCTGQSCFAENILFTFVTEFAFFRTLHSSNVNSTCELEQSLSFIQASLVLMDRELFVTSSLGSSTQLFSPSRTHELEISGLSIDLRIQHTCEVESQHLSQRVHFEPWTLFSLCNVKNQVLFVTQHVLKITDFYQLYIEKSDGDSK